MNVDELRQHAARLRQTSEGSLVATLLEMAADEIEELREEHGIMNVACVRYEKALDAIKTAAHVALSNDPPKETP